jgi:hypothetical protein
MVSINEVLEAMEALSTPNPNSDAMIKVLR